MRTPLPPLAAAAAAACLLLGACGRNAPADVATPTTGITSANVARLRRRAVTLPGTVDSSPIYLHGVLVGAAVHNVIVVTTTYGKTIAIDAETGTPLWIFTPGG